jgi:hypothetical protein
MPQFGGKNTKKTKKTSSSSKRHFTVIIDRGGKGGTNVPPKNMGFMFLQRLRLLPERL